MEKLPNILINYSSVKRYLKKLNDIRFGVFIKPVFDSRSFQYSHLFQCFNIIQFKATPHIVLKCICVKCTNFLYLKFKGHSQGHFNKLCESTNNKLDNQNRNQMEAIGYYTYYFWNK